MGEFITFERKVRLSGLIIAEITMVVGIIVMLVMIARAISGNL